MDRIVIFGATSAIAAQAALVHAGRGDRLHLVGRNADKLDDVARRCRAVAPREADRVTTQSADFAELASNEATVAGAADALGRLDRVLVAHGDLGDQLASERSFEAAASIIVANFTSVVALLIPVANRLEAARGGRIGVITSVAGDRGRPRNYTYGASKGALNVYLQGLRTRLVPAGVSVTTLKLGPVDSPMTRTHDKHLLFGKPAPVARAIVRAMDARVPESYAPRFWQAIMPIVKNTPETVFQRLSFLSGR